MSGLLTAEELLVLHDVEAVVGSAIADGLTRLCNPYPSAPYFVVSPGEGRTFETLPEAIEYALVRRSDGFPVEVYGANYEVTADAHTYGRGLTYDEEIRAWEAGL